MTAFTENWGVYGHEWAVSALKDAIRHGRSRHAYLIVGVEGVGKEALARGFAMALQCQQENIEDRPCGQCSACTRSLSGNFSDIIYANADNGNLKIEEIRRVAAQISLKPFEGRYRVAIFRDFDTALGRAQDALLKTLEEPAVTGVLIVLARTIEPVLPTITSRSQVLRLRLISQTTIRHALIERGADEKSAALLAALSGGRVGWAINAYHDPTALDARNGALDLLESLLTQNRSVRFSAADDLSKDRDALRTLLELWLSYWRDLMLISENATTPLTHIDRTITMRQLADVLTPETTLSGLRATTNLLDTLETNAGVRLALEVMFLDYPTLELTP